MRLSARPLNYSSINSFYAVDQWMIRAGEPNTLYFQLVDLDQVDCVTKTPLRYMPNTGVTIQVKFPSIDDDNVIVANATQVAGDGSIWKVDLTALQSPASGNVVISLTDGAVIRSFGLVNALNVEIVGQDGCC